MLILDNNRPGLMAQNRIPDPDSINYRNPYWPLFVAIRHAFCSKKVENAGSFYFLQRRIRQTVTSESEQLLSEI